MLTLRLLCECIFESIAPFSLGEGVFLPLRLELDQVAMGRPDWEAKLPLRCAIPGSIVEAKF